MLDHYSTHRPKSSVSGRDLQHAQVHARHSEKPKTALKVTQEALKSKGTCPGFSVLHTEALANLCSHCVSAWNILATPLTVISKWH